MVSASRLRHNNNKSTLSGALPTLFPNCYRASGCIWRARSLLTCLLRCLVSPLVSFGSGGTISREYE